MYEPYETWFLFAVLNGLGIMLAAEGLQRLGWLSNRETFLIYAIMMLFVIAPASHFLGYDQFMYMFQIMAVLSFLCWLFGNDDDDPKNRRKRLRSKIKSHIPRPRIVAVRPIQQGA
jgi:hypothetical protein